MTADTNVRTLEEDSNSLYRTQRIKFSSSKTITTPTKTIPLDKIKLKHTLNPQSRQLNEIFKRFKASHIKAANEKNEEYEKLEKWFNSQKSKVVDDSSTFCFIDFSEQRLPTNEEIEFMIDVAYCNSDITAIPTISHFNNPKQKEIEYDAYKKYLKVAIETIEQLNNKSIMGTIPKLAPKKVADLIGFYQNEGVNSYSLDMDGSNPISSAMRVFKVLKTLNKMGVLENSYIHGHNVGMRVNKTVDVIPAKDILGFGTGLSSLGEKRKIFKPNKSFIDLLKTNPNNKLRVFNKDNYGYWKDISVEQLKSVCPADCSFSLSEFDSVSQIGYLQKIFNAEQLSLESHNLRTIINEDADNSLDYIKRKKHVIENDIAVLEKGRNQIYR